MELKREVKTYQVDYICDNCGKGQMCATGFSLSSSPPQHAHVCNKCGTARVFLGKKYPMIVQEPVVEN